MATEFEYFNSKRIDRVYLSKSIAPNISLTDKKNEEIIKSKPYRLITKSFENEESATFTKHGQEVCLRITDGEKHEVLARFFEDDRKISRLVIQKFTKETGAPHKLSFSFHGDEIRMLYNFIKNISIIPINTEEKRKFDDDILKEIILSKEQAIKLVEQNSDLFDSILKTELTSEEIISLAKRKEQLIVFENLLNDENYFNKHKLEHSKKNDESVWQEFFEDNTWIFGYGLNYIFNSTLEGKKLEQTVSGFNFNQGGKRIDALMKSKGIISSFCFGEIKTHKKELLKEIVNPYRGECWAISDELAGSIAQVQKSVQKFIKNLPTKNEIKNKQGDLTGEQVFIYQPKSFVIIGSLGEFKAMNGINEDKYSSFELFRQNQTNPEIITFDELFERAKYIVQNSEGNI